MMHRTHPPPINFVFLFPKLTDGQLSPLKREIVCTLYSFTSPRIEKLKFSYFGTYEQSYMWVYIFSIIRTNVVFSKMLRPKAPHTPNQLGSNIFFTNFVYVSQTSNQLGTISMFTRSFLGKPRKRTRKQSRRSSMILGFSYINS